MKEIDFSKAILHDSAKEKYRLPMGAVATGTRVTMKLRIRDFSFEKAYLTVLRDTYKTEIEMHMDGEMAVAEYDAPAEPEVVWYWFSIRLHENRWLYYGAPASHTCGVGKVYWNTPPAYQLTVFDKDFTTPLWFKQANMYQIFPDRFKRGDMQNLTKGAAYHKSMGREVIIHENWDEEPLFEPTKGKMFYQPCDYFGGDLQGIEESLDYFSELGISVLYLNPIVEAASNHRYNTSDYLKVDPILGTEEDFERLVQAAEHRGIKIMLDGVFSHTGDDSVYFNRYGNYDTVGAYQSKDSPYFHWYQFTNWPDHYKSWWGFETLPEVDEMQQDWVDFIIENRDSVINTWLNRGAAGFRLDVADELPDETIERMRVALKQNGQDNVILGEVWEDATTKQAYGVNRTYALGRGLDSVMNYPLTNAVADFLLWNIDAHALKQFLVGQSQNYPQEMYYALMNLMSSHDVARMRTRLATRVDGDGLTREQQARFVVTAGQDEKGATLQKMAAVIQFTVPGVPSIYYGDETGMNGLRDPLNRKPYQVFDEDMRKHYKRLSNLRKAHDAFKTGHVVFFVHSADVLGILRFCVEGEDAFGNPAKDGVFLTVINRSYEPKKLVVDLFAESQQGLLQRHVQFFQDVELQRTVSCISGEAKEINVGLVEMAIPAQSFDIVEILWI